MRDDAVKIGLALACGAVIGWLWATRPSVLADIKWLDIMTAYGTVGSAAAAAYFGTRDGRRLHRHAIIRAQVIAARIAGKLEVLTAQLEMSADSLRKDAAAIGRESYREFVRTTVEAIRSDMSHDDAGAIALVSKDCSKALVTALSKCEFLERLLVFKVEDPSHVAAWVQSHLDECTQHLNAAIKECNRCSEWL